MCGAPAQGLSVEGIDVAKETVIQGSVVKESQPVGGAYVRLLDGTGEFTAEVVTSATGQFRFFAAPGEWTIVALAPGASARTVHEPGAAKNRNWPVALVTTSAVNSLEPSCSRTYAPPTGSPSLVT
jgi:hypothetical protein